MPDKKTFISYSRQDEAQVRPFLDALRKYSVPIWMDVDDVTYGQSIVAKINEAIKVCTDAAIFHSIHYATGSWTQEEKQALIFAQMSFPDRRLVVIKLDDTDLDPLLAHRLWSDGQDADLLAKFFANRSQRRQLDVAPPRPPREERPEGKGCERIPRFWESLDPSTLERIAKSVADHLVHGPTGGIPPALEVSTPECDCARLQFYPNIPRSHIDNLKAELQISAIHQRYIADLRKDLEIGGLGVFKTGFKITYEERLSKVDDSRDNLRNYLKSVVRTICKCAL